MGYEIRWKRRGARWDSPIRETWTLHTPLARDWDEAGAMVADIGKRHDPVVITVVPEDQVNKATKTNE